MSEKHRSLASYFDEPTRSWYEQTEVLGESLHEDSLTHDFHGQETPDQEDDLDSEMLGAWMWHPDHKKQVWVPDGEMDVFAKPSTKKFQEKGGESWKADHWGAADHERRYQQSQKARTERKGETKEQRAERLKNSKVERGVIRKQKSETLTKARATAMQVFLKNRSWNNDMAEVLVLVEAQKQELNAEKDATIQEQRALKGTKTGKERDQALHSLKTRLLLAPHDWMSQLKKIDAFCKSNGLQNIVGLDIPEKNSDGSGHYLFVALDFLSQVKKQIMTGMLNILVKKIKTPSPPKDRDMYLFVNCSYLGNTLRNQLKKDKYPKKPKKHLADSEALLAWTKKVRGLELAAFKVIHGKHAKIPKRLRNGPPPKSKRHAVMYPHGRRGPPMYFMPMPMYPPYYGGRGQRNPNKHHKKGKRHYNPTYEQGDPDDMFSPRRMEPDDDYAKPYLPNDWSAPPGPRRPTSNAYQMRASAPRMQRGYW
jgi:hypothetical protein